MTDLPKLIPPYWTAPGAVALSIKQPWAWLIVNGYKDIENRVWGTNRRGRFVVHASKEIDIKGYAYVRVHFPHIPLPAINELKTGGFVGSVELVDIIIDGMKHLDTGHPVRLKAHSSKWFNGPYGFVLRNANVCNFKKCKGALMFFNVQNQLSKTP